MHTKTILIAADHRGFALKAIFSAYLQKQGLTVIDLGTDSENSCDAGDFAVKMATELRTRPAARGILICGSGQAMAMTANRYQHLRAALCFNVTMARLARQHNDANILVLGADIIGKEVAMDCLHSFLTTELLTEPRYAVRRDKLTALGGL